MARLVLKFGGTSVADLERLERVARRIKAEWGQGHELAVIVSAMAGQTNYLVNLVRSASALADLREYDVVVSSGEQVTSGLLAIILQRLGVPARSWMGWQLPVRTTVQHGSARVEAIETAELRRRFKEERQVAVLAGFQGLADDGRTTTLGRGGSDTSAVALAAAIEADRCDIYTDVDGIYTSDPRIVAKARKLERITYEEMLEMASLGAKVLQTRSVELAMKHRLCVQVRSSFEDRPGTLVVDEEEIVEQAVVSGIAHSLDEAKVTLTRIPDRPGIAAAIFGPLADAAINIDMIVQNISLDGEITDMTFTVSRGELDRALMVLEKNRDTLRYESLERDDKVAKVSVVGVGMCSHAGVAQKMFTTLAEKGINIQVITTSEIKISVLVAEDYLELALRALHSAYGLDAD
ncbi:MAG: aspartate kinase [Rhodospirillales bacterium]|nr:aspartate kinase [Rhodospirillales bacterium]